MFANLPPGERLAAGELAALGHYQTFYSLTFEDVLHEFSVRHVAGEQIVLQRFVPSAPRGTVLLCHGYYDHTGLFGHVIEYLLSHGMEVVAFDQIGNGLSSGARVVIDSFDRYIEVMHAVVDEIAAATGGDLHIVSQSMGGALTMEYLHQQPGLIRGEVVLFAPLVRPYAWPINRWVFGLARLLIEERPRTITRNAANDEFLHLQHNDPLQADVLPVAWVQAMVDWFRRFESYPTSGVAPKIIQGKADRTVSWRWNQKVLGARYPVANWLWLDQASHHLANESDQARARMWRWLDEHCDWHR